MAIKGAYPHADSSVMGPVDRWWNRHFPAHSYARLAFLMVAAPIIAALVSWFRAATGMEEFTSGRYLTILIGSEVMVLFAWVVARMRRDEIDFGSESSEAKKADWRTPRVPWEMPSPESPTTLPTTSDVIVAPRKPSIPGLYDYALTLAISFVTWAILLVFFFEIGPTLADNLAWAAIGAFAMSLVITFRYSPLVPIALAIAVGFPVAALMSVFFFFFMGGPDNILVMWALGSTIALTFLLPPWFTLRRLRGRWERFRIPNWVFTGVTSILMLLAIGFNSIGVGSSQLAVAEQPMTEQPLGPGAGIENFGTTSPEHAALTLYYAWRNGDRAAAERVAGKWVVDDLFAEDYDPAARFLGCGIDEGFAERCVIRTATEQILLAPSYPEENRYHVATIQRVGLDHQIDFSQQTQETPSPVASP